MQRMSQHQQIFGAVNEEGGQGGGTDKLARS